MLITMINLNLRHIFSIVDRTTKCQSFSGFISKKFGGSEVEFVDFKSIASTELSPSILKDYLSSE